MKTLVFSIVIAAVFAVTTPVSAQNVVTKCTNGTDTIFVRGYTCPAGWWPKY